MKTPIKFFMLGLFAAVLLFIGAFFALFFMGGGNQSPLVRLQRLPSGRIVKVTSFVMAWGTEHGERFPEKDELTLDYVSAAPAAGDDSWNREATEVFELVRPVSEQWGFKTATLEAFPSTTRVGRYYIYRFTQAPNGSWSSQRSAAKVHINDEDVFHK